MAVFSPSCERCITTHYTAVNVRPTGAEGAAVALGKGPPRRVPVGDVLVLPLLARQRVPLPADVELGAAARLVRHATPGPPHPAAKSGIFRY